MKTIVGIDAGASGGIAVLFHDGRLQASPIGNITELCEILKGIDFSKSIAFLEEVTGYIPGKAQPASRSFVLGKSYGAILGLLIGLGIPFYTVRPQKWQQGLSGLKGISYVERKRLLKEYATRAYPSLKPTLKTADAILIANYGRRVCNAT